jgi:serine/threonine-protein kinase
MAPDVVDLLNSALEGRYAIVRRIGEGGMATVFLAEDLRHGRNVALKVLKPDLASVVGGERFLSEIKTTANLQHPHILPLFDSGEVATFLFYVMPYVEGESLRDRLDREHQLPVDEAVKIATDVAEALQAAHEQGVVHRDIKPANILLSRGRPLVADFGIALAVGAAGGGRMTETGLSLGTPHYMSPEQATGETHIGPAADVYALGCVLYEMLAGEPPHSGATPQAILGRIITGTPDRVTEHRRTVPANVEAALERALEKVPADRFASAGAFAAALADPGFRHRVESGTASVAAAGGRRGWGLLSAAVGGALVVGTLFGWLLAPKSSGGASDELVVSSILPPEGEDFSERESFGALSPDGARFAFVSLSARGERTLWIRSLDSLHAEPLPATVGASAPFWSPDGESLGYFVGGRLMRHDLGGTPTRLCDAPTGSAGSWGENGLIVIATDRGIERTTADGGGCEVAIPSEVGRQPFEHPSLLPGGRGVLFERPAADQLSSSSVARGDLESGTVSTVIEDGMSPTFVPPHHVVYGRFSTVGTSILFGQALNSDFTAGEGPVVGVSGPVRVSNVVFAYSASNNGSIIYLPGFGDEGKLLVDRRGRVLDTLHQGGTWTHAFAGRNPWIAMGGASQLWLYDLDRGVPSQLVSSPVGTTTTFPVWSPGDTLVAYGGCRLSVVRVADLEVTDLVPAGPDCLRASDWSRDGRFLIADQRTGTDWLTSTLVAHDLENGTTVPVVDVAGSTSEGHLSPDGRWIAYRSDETGTSEVFVRPFLRSGRAIPVSREGGREPRWRADGRELFFESPDGRIMSVEVTPAPELLLSSPTTLFQAPGWSRPLFFDAGTPYDVSPDGELFAVRMTASSTTAVLVQNWFARLRGR